MAAVKVSTNTANAIADTAGARLNGGTFKVYSGSIPATADTAVSGTLLMTFNLGASGFSGAATGGTDTLAGVPITGTINAAGTAGYGALVNSSGVVEEYVDVGVSGSGATAILSTTTVPASGVVTLNSLTLTESPS